MKKIILALLLMTNPAFAATLVMDKDVANTAAISLNKLAAIANNSVIGNVSGGSVAPSQLNQQQLTSIVNAFTGDTGSGNGVKGAVPAPSAGDTGLGKFLHSSGGWSVFSVADGSITNSKTANMSNGTTKCRTTAGSGVPEDCTATQETALLNAFVGDSGSGGTKGLVPAPSTGDTGLGKFLMANGGYSVPPIPITPSSSRGAVIYSTGNAWAASIVAVPACQSISASNIDWSLGNCFTKTLSANTVFTFTNRVPGQTIMVRVTNTPSNYTLTWPNTATQGNSVLWTGSTIPTQTVGNSRDIWTIFYDGTEMYGNPTAGF